MEERAVEGRERYGRFCPVTALRAGSFRTHLAFLI